ncbi:hypothetical protein MIND_00410100 [Mycena indigotica]|uniref:Uncharacterized protein n=1 Tax=Mycena indigotica TaxID=2126181 RepID=A0A8H6W611_9AGAR|nr:uncharacterized protein MIND_00410100 [Mycena indigotica]KAF7306197.1 hypothetical protein MIND_00410100 [Mycena indigotica]
MKFIKSTGSSFLKKVKEAAPLVIETRQAYIDLESSFEPASIATWTTLAEQWESGASQQPNPYRNPFESEGKEAFLAGVRHKLAAEAAAQEAAGAASGAVRDDMHVTELIAGGLQLEEPRSESKRVPC